MKGLRHYAMLKNCSIPPSTESVFKGESLPQRYCVLPADCMGAFLTGRIQLLLAAIAGSSNQEKKKKHRLVVLKPINGSTSAQPASL